MPPEPPLRPASSVFGTTAEARTALLQGLLIATIVVAALWLGRDVLLPLALAILLSFVLTPPLNFLRRLKVPRVIGVGLLVSALVAIVVLLGWLMTQQARQLATDLPRYQYIISDKIGAVREGMAASPVFERAGETLKRLQQQLAGEDELSPDAEIGPEAEDKPIPVEIRQPEAEPFERFQRVAGTLLPPLVTAGIVLLLLVFILIQREDLRDRMIRLFGASDLQRATSAVNDAAARLSQYFLRQVLINTIYGVFITVALWMIGLPSPIVWGSLAALMRFVPFVGSYIAAAPPVLLAAAVDPGWTMALLTLGLFVVGEMTMGQVVEPLVYGRGTGLSPVAVVAAIVFWTWFWGPLGLILAVPITVSLVVLGRHVPPLNFLEVMLGDRPALTQQQSFYQRILTGDAAEATFQAELALKEGQPLVSYLDEVAMPALELGQTDMERGALDAEQLTRIQDTVEEIAEDLEDFTPRRWFRRKGGHADEEREGIASLDTVNEEKRPDITGDLPVAAAEELPKDWRVEKPVLCVGGRSQIDTAAASLLALALTRHGLNAEALKAETLSGAGIVSLRDGEARLACLSYFPVDASPAHLRYLVRRLRRILPPGCAIMVCAWAEEEGAPSIELLEETVGADIYATTMRQAVVSALEAAKGASPDTEAQVA
jgi:predicted PurR-regulated permease PerM